MDIQTFDFSVSLLKAILWQYDSAPKLKSLLNSKKAWYDTNQQQFWESWLTDVFDLRTANEFGLQVWAIILGFPLYLNQSNTSNPAWGFDGGDTVNFDNGNFQGNSSSVVFPVEVRRLALQLRYFQLVSSGTVPETNRMLKYLFGSSGVAYLRDNHDMSQTYVFEFAPDYYTQYLLNNYDILPRPAGVYSTVEFP